MHCICLVSVPVIVWLCIFCVNCVIAVVTSADAAQLRIMSGKNAAVKNKRTGVPFYEFMSYLTLSCRKKLSPHAIIDACRVYPPSRVWQHLTTTKQDGKKTRKKYKYNKNVVTSILFCALLHR